jgi:hypothetical protein
MAMFLAEISFLLALGLFASGLVLWHQGRQAGAGLLRGAGVVLVAGAVLTALCTGFFSVRYQLRGEFDHAYASHPASAGPGTTDPRVMGSAMMERRAPPMSPGEEARPPEAAPPGHEEHHPGADE